MNKSEMSSLHRNSFDFLGEVRDGLKAPPQQVMKGPTPIIEDNSEDFFVVHEPSVTVEESAEPHDFAPESRQWQALVNTSLW
jgi:hypothetical protein